MPPQLGLAWHPDCAAASVACVTPEPPTKQPALGTHRHACGAVLPASIARFVLGVSVGELLIVDIRTPGRVGYVLRDSTL